MHVGCARWLLMYMFKSPNTALLLYDIDNYSSSSGVDIVNYASIVLVLLPNIVLWGIRASCDYYHVEAVVNFFVSLT